MEDLSGAGGPGRGPDQQSGTNTHNQNLMNDFLGQQGGQQMQTGFEMDPNMMGNFGGEDAGLNTAYYNMGMMPPEMSGVDMQPQDIDSNQSMVFGQQNNFYNGSGNMSMGNLQNMGQFQHVGAQNMGSVTGNNMVPGRNPGQMQHQQQQLRQSMNMVPQNFGHMGPPQRRPSMLEFSSGQNSDFSNFMFTHNGVPADARSNQNAFDMTSPVLANQQAFQFPQQQQQLEQQTMRPGAQSRAQSYMSLGAQTPLSLGGGIAQRRANSLLMNQRRESQGSLALETPDFSQVMSAVDGYASATQSPIFNTVNMNEQFAMPGQNNFAGNMPMNNNANNTDMAGMANSNQQISTDFNIQPVLQNMNLYNNSAFPELPPEQMMQQAQMRPQPQHTNQQLPPQQQFIEGPNNQNQSIPQQDQQIKAKAGSNKFETSPKKGPRASKAKQNKTQKSQDISHSQQLSHTNSGPSESSPSNKVAQRQKSPESVSKPKKKQSNPQFNGDSKQESTPADPQNMEEKQKISLMETPAQVAPPLEDRPNLESGEHLSGTKNDTKDLTSTLRKTQTSSNEDEDAVDDSSESPPDESMRNFGAFAPTYQYKSDAQGNNFVSGPDISSVEQSSKKDLPSYLNIYSSTGFDMLGVLMRVATRRDPQINIGAVDLSCAFVVCDVDQHDLPIVYCSDMFEKLTGYVKQEILGRNCRFLQAPDGRVQSGVKRKYVDDNSVYHLKSQIKKKQEAQISLINYRKGGQPFMNLLTMIPVPWNGPDIKYYVGFQVDLVEQPASITKKHGDGTYSINYQRGSLPSYNINATPESSEMRPDHRTDITAPNEVSTILATIGVTESGISQSLWDKILVENADDVVYVLSLKGIIQYISPACKKILEYEPIELLGAALSSICHPSDIVPVTRELKDASPETPVNVVFRIRRKLSGYTWFESQGSLHLEQGKGRKCIILVGRQRPIYAVNRSDITGDFGEQELWSKMSTSGMFLFVSAHAKSLLDRQPDELVGTSAQALMRVEARAEFGQALEIARSGEQITFKHDVQNKRGQSLQAQTTLYPGDAKSNSKPTFLIAQTRLLRPSRTHATLHKQTSNASDQVSTMNESVSSATTSLQSGGTKLSNSLSGGVSIASRLSQPQQARTLEAHNTTLAGCHGLQIGNQDEAIANEDNIFDELQTTRSTSWQFELRQMEKSNRLLAEELQALLSERKKRKRRKGSGMTEKECANCHTRSTPEWRRGPSGQRDLCNSCGLRWAKQSGKLSPRTSPHHRMSLPSNFSPAGISGSNPSASQTPVSDSAASVPVSTSASNDKESRRTPHESARPESKLKPMESAGSGGTGGTTPHANSHRTKSDATSPREKDVASPKQASAQDQETFEPSDQNINVGGNIESGPERASKQEVDDGIIDLDADADAEEDMEEVQHFQGMPTVTTDSVAAEQGGRQIMEAQRNSAANMNVDESDVKKDVDNANVDTQMEGG